MYQKIYNPKTNRKVSIYSKIGKQVLYQYYMQIGGHTNKCSFQNGSCKQTSGDDDIVNCKLNHYPSGRKVCSTVNYLKKPLAHKPIPLSEPVAHKPPPLSVTVSSKPAETINPSPISVETPEIISRELCGINPKTNMCNAKFKDKYCVQILKNGRKVCVKTNSI